MTARYLGAAGAIPFIACAAGLWLPGAWSALAFTGLRSYGAIILSFLGGVHWGLAIEAVDRSTFRTLGASVVPAVWAWFAVLIGGSASLITLAVGFAALLAYDIGETRAGRAPAWYPKLRVPLTVVDVACLLIGSLKA